MLRMLLQQTTQVARVTKITLVSCNDDNQSKKVELWNKPDNQPIWWYLLPDARPKMYVFTWVTKSLVYFLNTKACCRMPQAKFHTTFVLIIVKVSVESGQTQWSIIIFAFQPCRYGCPGVHNSTVECLFIDLNLIFVFAEQKNTHNMRKSTLFLQYFRTCSCPCLE